MQSFIESLIDELSIGGNHSLVHYRQHLADELTIGGNQNVVVELVALHNDCTGVVEHFDTFVFVNVRVALVPHKANEFHVLLHGFRDGVLLKLLVDRSGVIRHPATRRQCRVPLMLD